MFRRALACHPETCVRAPVSRYEICSGQSNTETGCFSSILVRLDQLPASFLQFSNLLHINITVLRRKSGAKSWKVQCNYVSDIVWGSGQNSAFILFIRRLRA